MDIIELKERSQSVLDGLLEIWEGSVRATHLFLSDEEILKIKEYVPQALIAVDKLFIAEENGIPVAFMGVDDGSLEMLFIAPEERGKGIGRLLLQHGIGNHGVNRLTVNEQNPQAGGFYEHMGFICIRGQSLMGRVILIHCFTCAYDGNMIFVRQSRM